MKKTAMIISGVILVLGCLTLGFSLLVSAILPNLLLVYLSVNPSSYSHNILYPLMGGPYVFSVIEIIAGIIGVRYFGFKMKD